MKIAIVGYGDEGQASYAYYAKKDNDITIVDTSDRPKYKTPQGVKLISGNDALSQLDDFDLVLRSPSIRPDSIKTNGKVWSGTNEFFAQCPCPIIGITGTKGKGTTASLIFETLKASGIRAHLVGNIGTPALQVLPDIKSNDVVVFELSSFQLWDLKKSPHIAVLLVIVEEHQDVHRSVEEYVNAKAQITLHQDAADVLIHHPTNEYVQTIVAQSKAQKLAYMQAPAAYVEHDNICIDGQVICATKELGLIGAHNVENACAAATAVWQVARDMQALKNTLKSYKGLPHRLEFVAEKNGVRYYDDSQSTAPISTIAAMNTFDESSVVILGGSDKGIDLEPVVAALDERHTVILIGQMSGTLEGLLRQRGFSNYTNLGSDTTMQDIVALAAKQSKKGGVVLLSPACASFGMFKDYIDRGEQFKAAVQALS